MIAHQASYNTFSQERELITNLSVIYWIILAECISIYSFIRGQEAIKETGIPFQQKTEIVCKVSME